MKIKAKVDFKNLHIYLQNQIKIAEKQNLFKSHEDTIEKAVVTYTPVKTGKLLRTTKLKIIDGFNAELMIQKYGKEHSEGNNRRTPSYYLEKIKLDVETEISNDLRKKGYKIIKRS